MTGAFLHCDRCDVKIGSGVNKTYAWWNARENGAVMVGTEDLCCDCGTAGIGHIRLEGGAA